MLQRITTRKGRFFQRARNECIALKESYLKPHRVLEDLKVMKVFMEAYTNVSTMRMMRMGNGNVDGNMANINHGQSHTAKIGRAHV